MNININYATCPSCKNIFQKTHLKYHYENCPKRIIKKEHKQEYKQEHKQEHKQEYKQEYKQEKKQEYKQEHKREQHIREKYQQNNQIERYIKPELISYNDAVLNHFFSEYDKLFTEYVRNKCIALVGPAESILDTNKGHVIDKFDIIVRLNKTIPVPEKLKKDIGSRVDVVYNSLNTSDFPGENNLNTKLYKKNGVNFVCSSYPFNHAIFHDDIKNYVHKYKFDIPLKVMNDTKFHNFEKLLGTRPYTGTCAIMDLLSYPIQYLYITGLDFYHTKYYNEYRIMSKGSQKYTKNNNIHKAKPQLEYLRNISFVDNRIILDEFLDKLLYYDYYKVLKNLKSFDKDNIYHYGDQFLKRYFEMKVSEVTFTKSISNKYTNKSTEVPLLIITDNKYFQKNNDEYCLFLTNNKNDLGILNFNQNIKRFIGDFYYIKNPKNEPSIYINDKFLLHLKSILTRINIHNCNINIAILLSIMLYLPDKHFFSKYEILNSWKITTEEKRLLLFLIKKNILKVF